MTDIYSMRRTRRLYTLEDAAEEMLRPRYGRGTTGRMGRRPRGAAPAVGARPVAPAGGVEKVGV